MRIVGRSRLIGNPSEPSGCKGIIGEEKKRKIDGSLEGKKKKKESKVKPGLDERDGYLVVGGIMIRCSTGVTRQFSI